MSTPTGNVPPVRSTRERPVRTQPKPLAAKDATVAAGSRAETVKRKRGNNLYGNIGIPKCDRCRRLKSKCEYKNPGDKCQKCILRGKDCSEKLLAKDAGDDRPDPNKCPLGQEQVPERWNVDEEILPKLLAKFDPDVDPVRVEDKLHSEIEEQRSRRLSAREIMEEREDMDDEDDDIDDQSEYTDRERAGEGYFAMADSFPSPPTFVDTTQRFNNRTQIRSPANDNQMQIDSRPQLPPQSFSHFPDPQIGNNHQRPRVHFATTPTQSPSFTPASQLSPQAASSRQTPHSYSTLTGNRSRSPNPGTPDPRRTGTSAGYVDPRDLTSQFSGFSVSAPGGPRYPAAPRLGDDIHQQRRESRPVQSQQSFTPNQGPLFGPAPQVSPDWYLDTNMDISGDLLNYWPPRGPQ